MKKLIILMVAMTLFTCAKVSAQQEAAYPPDVVSNLVLNAQCSSAPSGKTANIYYRLNGGAWILASNLSSTTCVTVTTFDNLAPGDILDFSVENSVNSSSVAYTGSLGSTCSSTGTLYAESRLVDCGSMWSYTYSADTTISIHIAVTGGNFNPCF